MSIKNEENYLLVKSNKIGLQCVYKKCENYSLWVWGCSDIGIVNAEKVKMVKNGKIKEKELFSVREQLKDF